MTLHRNWQDFTALHSNKAGARDAFERVCETLFRQIYSGQNVQQVEVRQGDGGIDIFVGEIAVAPITVIQCKFFIDKFEAAQQQQIRNSFEKVCNNKDFEVKQWILCIPIVLDLKSNIWWSSWKSKKLDEHNKNSEFITLKNGNELIDLLKENNLYNSSFDIKDSILIENINRNIETILANKKELSNPKNNEKLKNILFSNYSIECEPYYVERECDKTFKGILHNEINIWIHGKSGTGKTALLNRNMLIENRDYIYCDLSPIRIKTEKDIWESIIEDIETKIEKVFPDIEKNVKNIAKFLFECRLKSNTIIIIDEMHCTDSNIINDFCNSILNLTRFYSKKIKKNIIFVISSIFSPCNHTIQKEKLIESFEIITTNNWNESIETLFKIQKVSLGININEENKSFIINHCNNTPRLLSVIMRKIFFSNDCSNENIERLVIESQNEFAL